LGHTRKCPVVSNSIPRERAARWRLRAPVPVQCDLRRDPSCRRAPPRCRLPRMEASASLARFAMRSGAIGHLQRAVFRRPRVALRGSARAYNSSLPRAHRTDREGGALRFVRLLSHAPKPPAPPSPVPPSDPPPAARNWNAANALTMCRFAAAPLAAHFILGQQHTLALLTVAAAGATDAVDGWVARRYNLQTTLGSYLDPAADKLLVACSFGALAVDGTFPPWLVGIVVGRDVILASVAVLLRVRHSPRSWRALWKVDDLPRLAVQPLPISKLNTGLQLLLTVSGIAFAGQYGIVTEGVLHALGVATAATTVGSFGAYCYHHACPGRRRR
jgi:phosphatidylglycerophosphate synthase